MEHYRTPIRPTSTIRLPLLHPQCIPSGELMGRHREINIRPEEIRPATQNQWRYLGFLLEQLPDTTRDLRISESEHIESIEDVSRLIDIVKKEVEDDKRKETLQV